MEFLTDYTTLRFIWWLLLGAIFWFFAVSEGFDMGVAVISPIIGEKDDERRLMLNTVGPVWEGNQIWLILGAGAIFAAWPLVYGVLFSGFYLPFFAVLTTLILRPVGFKFRSKIHNASWRHAWDWCLFLGGAVPALSFGLVLGGLVSGASFFFDSSSMHLWVSANIVNLLQPLPLCSALLWLLLFVTHGGLYLHLKLESPLVNKIKRLLPLRFWVSILLFFAFLCVWRLTVPDRSVVMATNLPSNPLFKSVMQLPMGKGVLSWLPQGFMLYGLVLFTALTAGMIALYPARTRLVFVLNALRMGVVIATIGIGNFPIIIASLTHIDHSLTLWDASSSRLTLLIMLVAVILLLPIMLVCTAWVYKVLKGPLSAKDVEKKSKELY
ncbi:MAG: cytochrome d ubiquinol oxidase subunit II [Holosporaceae bacterium]